MALTQCTDGNVDALIDAVLSSAVDLAGILDPELHIRADSQPFHIRMYKGE